MITKRRLLSLTQRQKNACVLMRALISVLIFSFAISSNAQLKGHHMLGDAGIQSGSQAPSNTITLIGIGYNYHTSQFRNSDGNKIETPDVNAFATGFGASWISNFKVLGGTYGATVLLSFTTSKIDGNQVYSKTPLAFTDLYIQPVQLAWKTKQADFVAGYALYLPTGRYELGGSDNSGLGMTSNELSGGTTLYVDQKKQYSFSALLSYAVASEKKGTDIKTGDLLSIEGGFARSIYKPVKETPIPMAINVGMVYYMQFKMTSDRIPIGNSIFYGSGDKVLAFGVEADIFIPKPMLSLGIRWLGEIEAVNRFKGNAVFFQVAKVFSTAK